MVRSPPSPKPRKRNSKGSPILGEPEVVDLLIAGGKVKRGSTLVPEQRDILSEVGHIGAGRASGELSRVVGSIVRVSQPKVAFFSMSDGLKDGIPPGETVLVFSHVQGDARGEIMMLWDAGSALVLADVLQKKQMGTTKSLAADEDQGCLVANGGQLCERYLSAVGSLLDLKLDPSGFRLLAAGGKTLSNFLSVSVLAGKENALYLRILTEFSTTYEAQKNKTPLKGSLVLLLEMDSVVGMLKAVKEKLEHLVI